jgi:hypothetical protein
MSSGGDPAAVAGPTAAVAAEPGAPLQHFAQTVGDPSLVAVLAATSAARTDLIRNAWQESRMVAKNEDQRAIWYRRGTHTRDGVTT